MSQSSTNSAILIALITIAAIFLAAYMYKHFKARMMAAAGSSEGEATTIIAVNNSHSDEDSSVHHHHAPCGQPVDCHGAPLNGAVDVVASESSQQGQQGGHSYGGHNGYNYGGHSNGHSNYAGCGSNNYDM